MALDLHTERFVGGDSARGHVANALSLLHCEDRGLLTADETRDRLRVRLVQALEAIDGQDRAIRALRLQVQAYEMERE